MKDPVSKSEKILTIKLKKYLTLIKDLLEPVISFPNTIINKWTMVIINCDTSITGTKIC